MQYLTTCVLALGLFAVPALSQITVNRETSVFIDQREPQSLQLAVKDLASDLQKSFHHPVAVVH
ncbi:MAG: hypothetical protein P8Z30_02660, partial [Acidobacteriota bacterium]